MSNVNLRCASITCRQLLSVPAALRGQTVACKYCKRVMRVPGNKVDPVPQVGAK